MERKNEVGVMNGMNEEMNASDGRCIVWSALNKINET